jgi:hypothetical protein
MSQEEVKSELGDEVVESQEQTQEPPLNRAQRRALATGKKGAATNSGLSNYGNTGGINNRGSMPAGQGGKIQSRGASRGK